MSILLGGKGLNKLLAICPKSVRDCTAKRQNRKKGKFLFLIVHEVIKIPSVLRKPSLIMHVYYHDRMHGRF